MENDWEDVAKDNALPLTLIGLGIGWLLLANSGAMGISGGGGGRSMGRRAGVGGLRGGYRSGGAGSQGLMSRTYEQAKDRVGTAMDSVRRGAEELRHRAGSQMDHLRGRSERTTDEGYDSVADYEAGEDDATDADLRHSKAHGGPSIRGAWTGGGRSEGMMHGMTSQARNAGESLWEVIDAHPLAVGLVGVALGAAIGASLPATETEDEWMGAYRDRLAEQAWTEGEGYLERATEVAREAAMAGVDAARDKAREEMDPATLPPSPPR